MDKLGKLYKKACNQTVGGYEAYEQQTVKLMLEHVVYSYDGLNDMLFIQRAVNLIQDALTDTIIDKLEEEQRAYENGSYVDEQELNEYADNFGRAMLYPNLKVKGPKGINQYDVKQLQTHIHNMEQNRSYSLRVHMKKDNTGGVIKVADHGGFYKFSHDPDTPRYDITDFCYYHKSFSEWPGRTEYLHARPYQDSIDFTKSLLHNINRVVNETD